jgi:hypothetical protein
MIVFVPPVMSASIYGGIDFDIAFPSIMHIGR